MSGTPKTDEFIGWIRNQLDGAEDNAEYVLDQLGKHSRGLELELERVKRALGFEKAFQQQYLAERNRAWDGLEKARNIIVNTLYHYHGPEEVAMEKRQREQEQSGE